MSCFCGSFHTDSPRRFCSANLIKTIDALRFKSEGATAGRLPALTPAHAASLMRFRSSSKGLSAAPWLKAERVWNGARMPVCTFHTHVWHWVEIVEQSAAIWLSGVRERALKPWRFPLFKIYIERRGRAEYKWDHIFALGAFLDVELWKATCTSAKTLFTWGEFAYPPRAPRQGALN